MTPKLPSVRELARELRKIHEAWSYLYGGGEYVAFELEPQPYPSYDNFAWVVRITSGCGEQYGCEYIPGDSAPFDATAAARRLLSDARAGLACQHDRSVRKG